MKIALICYHKNTGQYPKEWIDAFRESIHNQSHKDFDIFDMDYGGGKERIFQSAFHSKEFLTFAHAMNYLIDFCFESGYDYVLNTNCDDLYNLNRIEKQYTYMQLGYDVISSNFSLISDDKIVHTHYFDKLDVKAELYKNHNIICHPVVAISKKFWENNRYIPEEIPFEDLKLWQRSLKSGHKFIILPETLCYHRLHNNSVGHKKGEI